MAAGFRKGFENDLSNSRLCVCAASHCPHQSRPEHSSQPAGYAIGLAVPQSPDDCPICARTEGTRAVGDGSNGEDEEEDAVKELDKEEMEKVRGRRKKRTCLGRLRDVWTGMRRKLWGIVESKYFSRGIMIAILINTISMGIEHHNQVIILFTTRLFYLYMCLNWLKSECSGLIRLEPSWFLSVCFAVFVGVQLVFR